MFLFGPLPYAVLWCVSDTVSLASPAYVNPACCSSTGPLLLLLQAKYCLGVIGRHSTCEHKVFSPSCTTTHALLSRCIRSLSTSIGMLRQRALDLAAFEAFAVSGGACNTHTFGQQERDAIDGGGKGCRCIKFCATTPDTPSQTPLEMQPRQ